MPLSTISMDIRVKCSVHLCFAMVHRHISLVKSLTQIHGFLQTRQAYLHLPGMFLSVTTLMNEG